MKHSSGKFDKSKVFWTHSPSFGERTSSWLALMALTSLCRVICKTQTNLLGQSAIPFSVTSQIYFELKNSTGGTLTRIRRRGVASAFKASSTSTTTYLSHIPLYKGMFANPICTGTQGWRLEGFKEQPQA